MVFSTPVQPAAASPTRVRRRKADVADIRTVDAKKFCGSIDGCPHLTPEQRMRVKTFFFGAETTRKHQSEWFKPDAAPLVRTIIRRLCTVPEWISAEDIKQLIKDADTNGVLAGNLKKAINQFGSTLFQRFVNRAKDTTGAGRVHNNLAGRDPDMAAECHLCFVRDSEVTYEDGRAAGAAQHACHVCKMMWCATCSAQINSCPYCRAPFKK